MIKLTATAINQVKDIITTSDSYPETTYLRVYITGGGCSGFNYSLQLIESKGYNPKKDSKYEQDGITIVVDKKSALYIDGTTVDYIKGLTKSGFSFINPNANKTCGCGSSFSV